MKTTITTTTTTRCVTFGDGGWMLVGGEPREAKAKYTSTPGYCISQFTFSSIFDMKNIQMHMKEMHSMQYIYIYIL